MSDDVATETMDDVTARTIGPGRPEPHRVPRPASIGTARGQVTVPLANTVRDALSGSGRPSSSPGSQRYAEVRELGRGGMGRVAEATDSWLGRRVAIKHLLAPDTGGAMRKRFDIEALVTAQLDHPGIPAVYERDTSEGGQPYYTMRLVDGEPLAKLLREAASFEARMRLLPVVVRVAHTLAFAHERGVVHRDVKPDNVVVGPHGDAVLLDWGIAKVRGLGDAQAAGHAIDSGLAPGLTLHGSVLGTPAYMAPEQARGEIDAIDERTDVFALGAMLFHLLVGRAPYNGANVTDILHAARQGTPPAIDREAPHAPEPLQAVVRKAMSADPSARHRSAGEFAQELEAFTAQAVSRPVSRGIERLIATTSWSSLVVCLLLTVGGWWRMPTTFREMGDSAFVTLGFFTVGMAVGLVEWQTQGRHRLAALGLALVAVTSSNAVAGAVSGLLQVYKYLERPEILASAVRYREALATGHREALGNVPYGLSLALLQLMVMALAWRRAQKPQPQP